MHLSPQANSKVSFPTSIGLEFLPPCGGAAFELVGHELHSLFLFFYFFYGTLM